MARRVLNVSRSGKRELDLFLRMSTTLPFAFDRQSPLLVTVRHPEECILLFWLQRNRRRLAASCCQHSVAHAGEIHLSAPNKTDWAVAPDRLGSTLFVLEGEESRACGMRDSLAVYG